MCTTRNTEDKLGSSKPPSPVPASTLRWASILIETIHLTAPGLNLKATDTPCDCESSKHYITTFRGNWKINKILFKTFYGISF